MEITANANMQQILSNVTTTLSNIVPLTNSVKNHALEIRCFDIRLQLAILDANKSSTERTTLLINLSRLLINFANKYKNTKTQKIYYKQLYKPNLCKVPKEKQNNWLY